MHDVSRYFSMASEDGGYMRTAAQLHIVEQDILKLMHTVADAVEELSNMPYVRTDVFKQHRQQIFVLADKVRTGLHREIGRVIVPGVIAEYTSHAERQDAEVARAREDVILSRLTSALNALDAASPKVSST